MSLKYSPKAIESYSRFYKKFNSITIFIEDKNGRHMYERVIEKILPELKISRIFPLDSRKNVEDQWRENYRKKDRIYIIDGDLDLIKRKPLKKSNLFQLNRYCIENYLVNSNSILESVKDHYFNEIEAVEFNNKIKKIEQDAHKNFVSLFILYFFIHEHQLGVQNVRDGCARFLENENICRKKLFNRKRELIKLLYNNIGKITYISERKKLKKRQIKGKNIISYKNFVFPLIHNYISSTYGYSSSQKVLISQSTRVIEEKKFQYLRKEIKKRIN